MNVEKLTLDELKLALTMANGFISVAANNLNCDIKTVYNYLNKYPELKEHLHSIKEMTKDFAESKLIEHIKNDNVQMLKFYLETQAKDRGYTVRQENINMDVKTFDDLPTLNDLNVK